MLKTEHSDLDLEKILNGISGSKCTGNGSAPLPTASIRLCICTKRKRFGRLGPHSHLRQAVLRSLIPRSSSKKYIFRPKPHKGRDCNKRGGGDPKDEVMK